MGTRGNAQEKYNEVEMSQKSGQQNWHENIDFYQLGHI